MNWPDEPNDVPLGDDRFAGEVDRPADRDAMADTLARRAAEGAGLYPQGGRTALEFGGVPERPGVAIDVTALGRVVDYPAADMTITVEAGCTLDALGRVLEAEGQRLPLEAPDPDRATLGGIFATDTSGPRRFGLGRPRDLILGVRFANSAGELIKGGGRVVKNVAGYDFPRLLTGSVGSLGVIVEMTLKTRPKPEASALCWVPVGAEQLGPMLDALNTSRTRPVAIEVLNRSAASEVFRSAGLDASAGGPTLLVGFEGTAEVVAWQVDALAGEPGGPAFEALRDEAAGPLWGALARFQAGDAPLAFKATMRPSAVARFVSEVDPGRWALQVHAGNGVAWGLGRGGVPVAELADEVPALRARALDADGNLTLPRCPTEMKATLGVWGAPRGDREIARAIKRALDPGGLMNPGRFL